MLGRCSDWERVLTVSHLQHANAQSNEGNAVPSGVWPKLIQSGEVNRRQQRVVGNPACECKYEVNLTNTRCVSISYGLWGHANSAPDQRLDASL